MTDYLEDSWIQFLKDHGLMDNSGNIIHINDSINMFELINYFYVKFLDERGLIDENGNILEPGEEIWQDWTY